MTFLFTYDHYEKILKLAKRKGYKFVKYTDVDALSKDQKYIILRHDIDFSLEKALEMAKIEQVLGVSATYFIMLTSGFYNVLSPSAQKIMQTLLSYGHDIGLHYDDRDRQYQTFEHFKVKVTQEANFLSSIIHKQVNTVSFHVPSERILTGDFEFDGLNKAYEKRFFTNIKYLSDSRKRWRDSSIDDVLMSGEYKNIQLLIHPIWWHQQQISFQDSLKECISLHIKSLFDCFDETIADFPIEVKRHFGIDNQ